MNKQLFLTLAFSIPILSVAPVLAAPITFNTALPVSEDEVLVAGQLLYRETEDAAGQEQSTAALVSVIGYGVTPELTLFGVVPYSRHSLNTATGDRHASGLGDARAFARYTVYRNDFRGGTFRIAPFAGVKAPTGTSRARDARGVLPPPLQPGSGSWAAFGGLVGTWASVDYNLDAQIAYQANGRKGGARPGDLINADASLQYRLSPHPLDGDAPGWLYAVIEVNFAQEGRMRLGSMADPNSGGSRLYLTPGLQYAAKRWIAEAAIQLPVTQNLNGPN